MHSFPKFPGFLIKRAIISKDSGGENKGDT